MDLTTCGSAINRILLIEYFLILGKNHIKLCKLTWRQIYDLLVSEKKKKADYRTVCYDDPDLHENKKSVTTVLPWALCVLGCRILSLTLCNNL